MGIQIIQILAGFISSIIFAIGQISMLVKVLKTRNLKSYTLSNLVLANLGNLIDWVYLVTVPGPLWYLHSFFTITTAVMLLFYLCYELGLKKFKLENQQPNIRNLSLVKKTAVAIARGD